MIFSKRLLLAIFLISIAPIGLLYGIASILALDSFGQLEQQDTRKTIGFLSHTISLKTSYLESKSADWANWDDTYAYMKDSNPTFIKSNINEQTFEDLKLNFILLVDSAGRIAFSRGFDLTTKQETLLPQGLLKELSPNLLVQPDRASLEVKAKGILRLPEGNLLVVSRPILNSNKQGSSRGTLIFASYLNLNRSDLSSESSRWSITLQRVGDPQILSDFQQAYAALSKDPKIFVLPLNQDLVAGYCLLPDFTGKPNLLLRVEIPRDIYKQGQANLRYLMVSLLIVGSVFGILFGTTSQALGRRLKNHLIALNRSKQEFFEAKELAEVTLSSIADAVIRTNVLGQVEYLNPIAEHLTGWQTAEAQGLMLTEICKILDEDTREPIANPVDIVLREGRIFGREKPTLLIHRDGREFAIDDSAAPIRTTDGQTIGVILIFRDITHERAMERLLSWEASHDYLTNLVNRREFERCLEQAVAIAKSQNHVHVLCYLDLDRFKIVNDTCGHFVGDELLHQVTNLMRARVRKSDVLARLGGDEFGLLLHECSVEQALQVATVLRESIETFRFVWQDKTFAIGASIGLVAIDANSCDTASILSAADAACFAAKEKGGNRAQVYQTDDREITQQRGQLQWVTKIDKALADNRFCLYAQSIIPLCPDRSVPPPPKHCEILLRMIDEDGTVVSPLTFIPVAERYNLMPAIDRWVIRTLFSSLAEIFQTTGTHGTEGSYPQYGVNLSGASINDDRTVDFLFEQFERSRIPPQAICFEITETVAIANLNKAVELIRKLKSIGCWFALDDFGSGMSSFAYLKTLPVDYLKIDGFFIQDIVRDRIAGAIVRSISSVAQEMGIQTIAEFVSNKAILAKVKMLGVDYAQGYGIDKPSPFAPGSIGMSATAMQDRSST